MTTFTPSPSGTRDVSGIEVPAVGAWTIDPGHTELAFIGRHFMLTKVRCRFTDVAGEVQIADDPGESSVSVRISMASVESGSSDRDDHLRSADFFDVERFPEATYRSTAVRWNGRTADVTGDLTIVGITRPVDLHVEYLGAAVDPWGGTRAIYSASAELDREDWGLTWNMALEAGGILVSKTVKVEIEMETVLQDG